LRNSPQEQFCGHFGSKKTSNPNQPQNYLDKYQGYIDF